MKPLKAHATEIIFKLINFVPWIFPDWLSDRASFYSGDDSRKLRERDDLIVTASFLDGDFSWKAVGVVVRIDHRELELIHQWMKRSAPPGRYDPEMDSHSFSTKFASLGGHCSLGWISFNSAKYLQQLMIIDLPGILCESCFITFDKLPSGFTYLSLYFLLSSEATTRIQNTDLCEIERYYYFQSFNPFSKRFRILAHYSRRQGIRKHIKENLNSIVKDVRLATTYILKTWNINKDLDELITIADFYRDSDTAYFQPPQEVQNKQNEQTENLKSSFVLITRNSNYYDVKICSDPCESFCYVPKDEGIQVDAFFIKSQFKETFLKLHDFPNCELSISESHLFWALHLDCFQQYKKIADYANVALLQNNNIDLESRYTILFNSLMKLESLDENILAIEKYINSECDVKYRDRSKEIILDQQKKVQDLRSSIEKRRNNSNTELQIENIKFHRCYSWIFALLVITQIFLAALTIDWDKKMKSLCLFNESVMSAIEFEYDNFIKDFR